MRKEAATHSSIVGWRFPWTEEPGGLQSIVWPRVRHDWVTSVHTHTHTRMLSQYLEWTLDSSHNAAIPNFIKNTKINPCFQPSYRVPSLLFRRLGVKKSSLPPGESNSIPTRSTYHEDVLLTIQILEQMAPWVRAGLSAMKSVIKTCGVTVLNSFYSFVTRSLSHVQLSVTPWTVACQASCPLLSSRACWNSCPLSQWCLPTVSSSVAPSSSCPQSFPVSRSKEI